jgi:hypothetical protein
MRNGVLTYDIDDWHLGPASIVQVREAVAKAGTEMKQSASRFFSHSSVAVCRPGYNAFE